MQFQCKAIPIVHAACMYTVPYGLLVIRLYLFGVYAYIYGVSLHICYVSCGGYRANILGFSGSAVRAVPLALPRHVETAGKGPGSRGAAAGTARGAAPSPTAAPPSMAVASCRSKPRATTERSLRAGSDRAASAAPLQSAPEIPLSLVRRCLFGGETYRRCNCSVVV